MVSLTKPPVSLTKPRPPNASIDKTLTKGLDLLEALAETESSRGISELASQLSLNKSNVHRLLQTLARCGYVTREASTERYLLSPKLWRIARRGRPFDALRRAVRPVLRDLVEEIDESVLFVVVEDEEMIPIDQVETQHLLRIYFTIGQSFPIDQVVAPGKTLTALQRIVLADRSEMDARLAAQKVQKQLQKGSAFADQLSASIADVRKSGFSILSNEWVTGASAVAVPVRDSSEHLFGVLSCFGPADRLTDSRLKKIQKTLSIAAEALSKRICE